MPMSEFEREVSTATGESLAVIRERGFSLVEMLSDSPQVIDWDAIYPADPVRRTRSRRKSNRSRVA